MLYMTFRSAWLPVTIACPVPWCPTDSRFVVTCVNVFDVWLSIFSMPFESAYCPTYRYDALLTSDPLSTFSVPLLLCATYRYLLFRFNVALFCSVTVGVFRP